jgi:nitroreductase
LHISRYILYLKGIGKKVKTDTLKGLVPEIEQRRARRMLRSDPIPDDVIERIMTAASFAPSCMNNQPWRFIVVREEAGLALVKEHLSRGNAWAAPSPCIILGTTKPELDCRLDGGRDYAFFDTGMAVMALQLQAAREGVYAHPIAGFRAPELGKALGIPGGYTLLIALILGYPGTGAQCLSEKQLADETSDRTRKPLSDIAAGESWTFSA